MKHLVYFAVGLIAAAAFIVVIYLLSSIWSSIPIILVVLAIIWGIYATGQEIMKNRL